MTAVCRTSVLGLAVLLAAATAAADMVVTAKESIRCLVISCDTSFTRLQLPSGGIRVFYTRDVCEVRLCDSSRVVEMAARLPQLRVTPDTGRPVPQYVDRASAMLRQRLERAREDHAGDFPGQARVVDTVAHRAAPDEMAAKCREMYVVLLECGRSNDTIAKLLRDVENEEAALRRIWPSGWAVCLPGALSSVPCGLLGIAIGASAVKPDWSGANELGGGMAGCILGGAAGSALGGAFGADTRRHTIVAHREYVNTLVGRANRAVLAEP